MRKHRKDQYYEHIQLKDPADGAKNKPKIWGSEAVNNKELEEGAAVAEGLFAFSWVILP